MVPGLSIPSVIIAARVVTALCTFAQLLGSLVILASTNGVMLVYVPAGRLLLIANRTRSLALLYAKIVSVSSPPMCRVLLEGATLVTPVRLSFEIAFVRIVNRVSIEDTTSVQPPATLVIVLSIN